MESNCIWMVRIIGETGRHNLCTRLQGLWQRTAFSAAFEISAAVVLLLCSMQGYHPLPLSPPPDFALSESLIASLTYLQ
jgi:hypothetical protein